MSFFTEELSLFRCSLTRSLINRVVASDIELFSFIACDLVFSVSPQKLVFEMGQLALLHLRFVVWLERVRLCV